MSKIIEETAAVEAAAAKMAELEASRRTGRTGLPAPMDSSPQGVRDEHPGAVAGALQGSTPLCISMQRSQMPLGLDESWHSRKAFYPVRKKRR